MNTQNFTVCGIQSGRNGKNINRFATVDWMAYQGAPIEGLTGRIKVENWWSGTKCADVTFSKVGSKWNKKGLPLRCLGYYYTEQIL